MEKPDLWAEQVKRMHTPCAHPVGWIDYRGVCIGCGASSEQVRQEHRDEQRRLTDERLADALERLVVLLEEKS